MERGSDREGDRLIERERDSEKKTERENNPAKIPRSKI